ncbi:MAG: hypothetical protein AAGD96_36720, partial [Chloroflexota bacterium]
MSIIMFPGNEPSNLEIKTEYSIEFDVLDTVWIPLADGKRVAARMWLPKIAHEHLVSTVLEYIPYRRRDGR